MPQQYIETMAVGDRVTVFGTERGYYEGKQGVIESLGTFEPPFIVYHAVLFDGHSDPVGIDRNYLRPIEN